MSKLQSVIGGKWKILISWYVSFYKVQRFGELMRRLDGITQSTLTKQLRELESDAETRKPWTRSYGITAGISISPLLKRAYRQGYRGLHKTASCRCPVQVLLLFTAWEPLIVTFGTIFQVSLRKNRPSHLNHVLAECAVNVHS
ncbi:winged helix-turn-helix transcriptional regulator [Parablautia muri]